MLPILRLCVSANKNVVIRQIQNLARIEAAPCAGIIQGSAARRCFSVEAGVAEKGEQKRERTAPPERTVFVTPSKKRTLMISGKWSSTADIPDVLTERQYDRAMWKVRTRLWTFMFIMWMIVSGWVIAMGREKRSEQTHHLVMEQFLEGLPKEERDRLREQYNLGRERVNK